MDVMRFTEIEHKFLVDDRFDLDAFSVALDALGPTRLTRLQVRDRYFLTEDGASRRYILRHRCEGQFMWEMWWFRHSRPGRESAHAMETGAC